MTDLLLTGIGQLVTNDPEREGLLGLIADAAVAMKAGRVAWVGPEADVLREFREYPELDCAGRAALPGFVDAHTHLVFAGDRSEEFARRLRGERYEDILASGGGIQATVAATRAAAADCFRTFRFRWRSMQAFRHTRRSHDRNAPGATE